MNTPIFNFVTEYIQSKYSMFHMPGHKGENILGLEQRDITEIKGADDLYHATGIILESENNATNIFGTKHTFYATNGSTQCVKAMLYLAYINRKSNTKTIISARNVHKSFVYACATLDIDVDWIYPKETENLCSCEVTPKQLEEKITNAKEKPFAVYVTSPDYLGSVQDIKGLSVVCKKYDVCLLVDNAHGAYLKFLDTPTHPIDLGADICCDSAHKTLPVLTGGAYLHISNNTNNNYELNARKALAMFGTSSPSYLVLQSLDLCNIYLENDYKSKLNSVIKTKNSIVKSLQNKGVVFKDSEPLKIVIDALAIGCSGEDLADYLRTYKIECEFCDSSYVVLMYSVSTKIDDFKKLEDALRKIRIKRPIFSNLFVIKNEKATSIREAVFSQTELISVEKANGRICSSVDCLCPPAIPIVVSGEKIDNETIKILKKYGIKHIEVIK